MCFLQELLPFGIYVSNVIPGAVATGTLDKSLHSSKASHPLFEKYRIKLHDQMVGGELKGGSTVPDVVAVVQQVVDAESPRFAYKVGSYTKQLLFMKKFMPAGILEKNLIKLANMPSKVDY